ncbi:hypothetical protein Q7P37_004020 [Cladosporium fusiforme]
MLPYVPTHIHQPLKACPLLPGPAASRPSFINTNQLPRLKAWIAPRRHILADCLFPCLPSLAPPPSQALTHALALALAHLTSPTAKRRGSALRRALIASAARNVVTTLRLLLVAGPPSLLPFTHPPPSARRLLQSVITIHVPVAAKERLSTADLLSCFISAQVSFRIEASTAEPRTASASSRLPRPRTGPHSISHLAVWPAPSPAALPLPSTTRQPASLPLRPRAICRPKPVSKVGFWSDVHSLLATDCTYSELLRSNPHSLDLLSYRAVYASSSLCVTAIVEEEKPQRDRTRTPQQPCGGLPSMGENMAPPSKRRKLLSSAQDVLQQSEVATRSSGPPFFHGVEHIRTSPSTPPANSASPQHVEEVHLEIRNQPIGNIADRLSMIRRQGTAAVSDIISTNSDADVVVAVTAEVDVFGSTTALTSATVTAELPDIPSLLSTSATTATVSDGSAEPTSDGSASSETRNSSAAPNSSNDSNSSESPSTTDAPSSTQSETNESSTTRSSSQSSNPSGYRSQNDQTTSSAASSSMAGTAPARSSRPDSQGTIVESSTSSNSSVSASTSQSSLSSASSSNRLNLTTSASTRTSGSSVYISDFTINLATVTSSSADSTSSVDFNALFMGTLSDGDIETFTRSDEEFTTTMADGQTATVSPSSEDSGTRDSSASVITISDERSTVRSTILSTAGPSSTQSNSGDNDGVGIAGAADQGPTGTSSGIASTSSAASDDAGDDDDTAPAGTIAGGVVGGAAGLALIVLIILLFLRRYKKRAQVGHSALPANSAGVAPEPDAGPSSGGPGMAERAGLMPFAGAVPALFRNQSRSQHSGTGTDGSERGFQRVSGRKLPSAFSEGMQSPPHPVSSPPPTMPLVSDDSHAERNLSSQSFYRDSTGFYGGDGSSTSPNPFSDTNAPLARGEAAEQLTMSPGPQRRPTVHAARSNVQNPSVATSGTPSWTPSAAPAFGRSETPVSLDGSRNSRFTEEV